MASNHTTNEYNNSKSINNEFLCNGRYHRLIFSDEYCPIFKGIHDPESKCYRYFVVTDRGYAFMRCTNKNCIDQMSPENGIKISKQKLKDIFPN